MNSVKLTQGKKRLEFSGASFDRLTHYLFRFPAKFHPPIVKTLIETYSTPGDRVLDPFCGSGSMLVEAVIAGRHAVGSDLDPVASFVPRVKTHRYDIPRLSISSRESLNNGTCFDPTHPPCRFLYLGEHPPDPLPEGYFPLDSLSTDLFRPFLELFPASLPAFAGRRKSILAYSLRT